LIVSDHFCLTAVNHFWLLIVFLPFQPLLGSGWAFAYKYGEISRLSQSSRLVFLRSSILLRWLRKFETLEILAAIELTV
jgi:hypothetical protein